MRTNFNSVQRYDIAVCEETWYEVRHIHGDFVLWEDYNSLLCAHRDMLEKISEIVGDHTFEE